MKRTALKGGLFLFAICLSAIVVYQWLSMPRIAYVDLPKVFNEFELKKDLEARLMSDYKDKSRIIDSLKLALGQTDIKVNGDFQKVGYQRQNIIQTAEALEYDHQNKSQELNGQIYKRLNEYVHEFAREEGYDFILGAEGSGIIMAADAKKDITEEVISYINRKYQDK